MSSSVYPMLCVGDVHIKPTNVHLVDRLETQLIEWIQRHRVQTVMLLGDILDTFERLHTQALNRAYRLLDALRQHAVVYVLVGNHDYINNQQFLTDQHWMNALKDWRNVTVVDRVVALGADTLCVPYVPPQRFVEALDAHDPSWSSKAYIFAHQEIRGCKMGAIVSTVGDEWNPDWPTLVSGHIHDAQSPQPNVVYVGASLPSAFGEQGGSRVLCIYGPGQSWTECILDLPKKKTVYAALDDLRALSYVQQIQDTAEQPEVEALRIVVKCEYDQFKVFTQTAEYEQLVQHGKCKVVHKPPPPPSASTVETPPPADVCTGTFVDAVRQRVLQRRDEWLYAAFYETVHGTTVNPRDWLIV